ncbi:MAG TPA: S-methyl-5-thioribose-1-phosphate isomerase [Bacteroidetes bacterium]|nr:S-methyl-5-thioribose-1-phosphate isomerase [Bacteroidota bacterium]
MKVKGVAQRSIWMENGQLDVVKVIDERHLPFEFVTEELRTVAEAARAIRDMHVRGAPLIGITAAYGMYLAALEIGDAADFDGKMMNAAEKLGETRPTAVNLAWALEQQLLCLGKGQSAQEKTAALLENAGRLAEEDVETCRMIGVHGLELIRKIAARKNGTPVNILTHCNAGWLATVDYGTATSPIYHAFEAGIDLHVWVDETRPRNQGARLTAWELGQHGVAHTVIPDNAGGHLMQHGMVDLVIVGSDRTTVTGDVANKIGTYLKALAAHDNNIPFYVALPGSTFDWTLMDGVRDIPIETRDSEEVTHIQGWDGEAIRKVQLTPHGSAAINYGFDVTPARLVTGLITERGICEASSFGILGLYPEFAPIA